ncbi:MAG: hypothetical protein M3O46_18200, partial [Myxococcota bacterium]|nr:hypothetical protein [Myxococcota bacterium]
IAFAVVSACSGQGEGELCNTKAGNSGNDDCSSGLVCTTSPTYALGRCCPQDRTKATTTVCSSNNAGGDASPAPPSPSAEASVDETGVDGTPGPSPTEASVDTSIDAPGESSGDVGTDGAGSDATTE